MHQLTTQDFQQLLEKQDGLCLSLYQSTHRSHPENAQDPIRFKNLVKELEASLESTYDSKEYQPLLTPFYDLADNFDFWQHTLDGIAVLANEDQFNVYHLQRPTPDFAVVSDSWHLKPLLRQTRTQDRYQVLCLTRSDVQIFEGNRYGLHQLSLDSEFPDTITKALGEKLTNPPKHINSDLDSVEIERFFRVVDKAVHEQVSKQSQLPLLLVTLAEYQGVFKKLSNNPYLQEEGLSIDPTALALDQLRQQSWQKMAPVIEQRVQEAVNRFNQAHGNGLANADPDRTVAAILDGRVELLLVDADKRVAGRIDHENRRVEYLDDFSAPDAEDVLDDMAEMVLRRGGEVLVIPSRAMPSDSGIASIYRY